VPKEKKTALFKMSIYKKTKEFEKLLPEELIVNGFRANQYEITDLRFTKSQALTLLQKKIDRRRSSI